MCIACRPGLMAFAKGGMNRRSFLAGAAVLAGASRADILAGGGSAFAATDVADTIFEGGTIITMDAVRPNAEALAVAGGRILALGSSAEVAALKGPQTKIIDLAGGTMLPGFIDPHMHFVFAYFDDWLDLGPFANKSMDEVKAKLVKAIAAAKPGDWVMGQMLDPLITPGTFDTSIQALDALAPNNPLFIMEDNGHIGYANSKAFATAKLTPAMADPPHGRFVRDAKGQFTGEIQEPPALGVLTAAAPKITPAQYIANIGKLFDHAASNGCTSVHDCGLGLIDPQLDLDCATAAMAANPPVRLAAYLVSTAMSDWEKLGLKPGAGSDRFRISGIKAWVDGSNQSGTGYMREPYLISDWGRGQPNYTAEALRNAVEQANDRGWQVGIHANGDSGIDMAIDAFEAALKKTPQPNARHRIEHCSILHPEQMDRMKTLGLSPSFLIGHVYFWGDAFQNRLLGPERANLLDPCRSAASKGLRFTLHSDYNVTPIEPLRYVHNAVTRMMQATGRQLNPSEAVTVMEALKAVTLDAAWQCHLDDITGSLEVGKYADLVVLDKDPTQIAPQEILGIKVKETWLGGERRFTGSRFAG